MIEKTAVRDVNGRAVSILERTLSPTEEAARLLYAQLKGKALSYASDAPPTFVVSRDAIHASVDHVELLGHVRALATADPALWAAMRWSTFEIRIGESPQQPAPAVSTSTTVRRVGFI